MAAIAGIHHVAIVAVDFRSTLDFYMNVLGMTLVACTVDFDQPEILQLYCGDRSGSPGSLLCILVCPQQKRGHGGLGQVSAVSFGVQRGTLAVWRRRLSRLGVSVLGRAWSFHEEHLCFNDPDGLEISLVEDMDNADASPGGVPGASMLDPGGIRIRGIEIQIPAVGPAAKLLVGALGFRRGRKDRAATRFRAGDGLGSGSIDLLTHPGPATGIQGAGIVSHVAWRVAGDGALNAILANLSNYGVTSTPVLDRMFFRIAYFRALGGIRFALATDGPGFGGLDATGQVGAKLILPAWLEPERKQIESRLGWRFPVPNRPLPN